MPKKMLPNNFSVNWTGFGTLIRVEYERMMRIITQTVVAPLIQALLYIFVFGQVVGSRIDSIQGHEYVDFALPGILMLSLISTVFAQSSTSLYFKRFAKHIEELLVAPIANATIIAAFVASSLMRGLIVAAGVFAIAVLFGAANLDNIFLFAFYVVSVSTVFSLLGLIVGMWAKGFEQLNVLGIFFITPLSFLGGVFYSITMLPDSLRLLALWNPFFYFIDGIRYSMIGVHEGSILFGVCFTLALIVLLGAIVIHLFNVGYGIRE